MENRAGMVALVGRPNVGKSTLMNTLIGDKVSIITPMAQTTRNQIRGIHNVPEGQIVYLDTPGIHQAKKQLNRYMVDVAFHSLEGVDLILYLVDASRPDEAVVEMQNASKKDKPHVGYGEDQMIIDRLNELNTPCFLVINKVDLISKKVNLLPLIEYYNGKGQFDEVIPISATEAEGTEVLVQEILKRLPEGPPLFPPEYATDRPERFLVSEIVREKVILTTREEIPHSTAIVVDVFDESERDDVDEEAGRRGLIHIEATVCVERDSQKGIIIGKRGARLKEIGSLARADIESLLGCRVFLKLWVKVDKNWSQNMRSLKRLGYEEI